MEDECDNLWWILFPALHHRRNVVRGNRARVQSVDAANEHAPIGWGQPREPPLLQNACLGSQRFLRSPNKPDWWARRDAPHSASLSISRFISLYLSISLSLFIYRYFSIYLSASFSIFIFLSLSFSLRLSLYIFFSFYLFWSPIFSYRTECLKVKFIWRRFG